MSFFPLIKVNVRVPNGHRQMQSYGRENTSSGHHRRWSIHSTRLVINMLLCGSDDSLWKLTDSELHVLIEILVSESLNCEQMGCIYIVRFKHNNMLHTNSATEVDNGDWLFLGVCLYKINQGAITLQHIYITP